MKITKESLKKIIKEEIDDIMGSSTEDPMISLAKIIKTDDFDLPMANDLFDSLTLDPNFRVSTTGLQHLHATIKDIFRDIEEKQGQGFQSNLDSESRKHHLQALFNKVKEVYFER